MIADEFTTFFTNEKLRVCGTVKDPLFLAADIANKIGDTDFHKKLRNADEKYVKKMYHKDFPSQKLGVFFFTEFGLYRYLLRSNLPKAEPFQLFVYEQLRTLRQKIVDSALLAEKIAKCEADRLGEQLKVAEEKVEKIRENSRDLARQLYDDFVADACPTGAIMFYISQYSVLRGNDIKFHNLDAELVAKLEHQSNYYFRGSREDQDEFRAYVFKKLDQIYPRRRIDDDW